MYPAAAVFKNACLPGPDIQLTPVDDAGQLKENREPPPHPHAVFGGYIHVITGVIFEGLQEQLEPCSLYGVMTQMMYSM